MKKLFIFSNANGYGGAERSMEDIVSLLNQDYTIRIFTSNEKHIENLKKITNIEIIKLKNGNSPIVTIKNLVNIFSVLKKEKEAKILINTNKGAFYISILSFFLRQNINLFIYIRDFQWKYQNFIFDTLKKYNPLYLFTSQAFFDVESYFSQNIKNYKIIPNFIDLSNDIEFYNKQLKDADEKIILIPAMVNRWKGIEYAIESLSLIKKEVMQYNIKLYIIGKVIDEEYFKELNDLIEKLSLSNIVIFKNYTNNIEKYYRKSWIVLNTSISQYGGPETFGRTILEAWKYQKPVISFNCGGPKYIINNGINGILVEEKNTEELSQKILFLLDVNNYQMIVNNERRILYNNFSTNKIKLLLKEVLK